MKCNSCCQQTRFPSRKLSYDMFDFCHIYAKSAWNISTLDITNVHFADGTMNNPSASKTPLSIKHFKKAAFRLGRQPCVDQEYTISFRTISSAFLAIRLTFCFHAIWFCAFRDLLIPVFSFSSSGLSNRTYCWHTTSTFFLLKATPYL